MALPPNVARQRVKGAREAVGLSREELGERFHARGHGKDDIARIERGHYPPKPPPELDPARAESLADLTGFPVAWFTEADLGAVLSGPEPGEVDQLRQVVAQQAKAQTRLSEELSEAQKAQREMLTRLERLERGGEGSG
jgi:transcriptional regulator with XRE-family HTH domain